MRVYFMRVIDIPLGQSGCLSHKMEKKVSIQKVIKHYLIEVLLSSLFFITVKIQIHKSIPFNNIHRLKVPFKIDK